VTKTAVSSNLSQLPPALRGAVLGRGWDLPAAHGDGLSGDVMVWEASNRAEGSLTAEQAGRVMERVRTGGGLLLTLTKVPGLAPLELGAMLPTTGWATQLWTSALLHPEPLAFGEVDGEFFGAGEGLPGLSVPYHLEIRPTAASERGQARYERYAFFHPMLKRDFPSRSLYWTRPLLNREWKVRVSGADVSRTPLLVTGRYGAGRVALLATSAAGIGDSVQAQGFWDGVLRWLQPGVSVGVGGEKARGTAELQLSSGDGGVRAQVRNMGSAEGSWQVVMRAVGWDGAILGDGRGALERAVTVKGKGTASVDLPLPAVSDVGDDSLRVKRCFRVRVGVLGSDGAVLMAEEEMDVDLRKPVQISVRRDNLYGFAYPFHAPGPLGVPGFQGRMGSRVDAYAYAPGQTVRAEIVVANGLVNLAPRCRVEDSSNRNNASVMALNDEATGMRKGPADRIQGYSMWTGTAGVENVVSFTLPGKGMVAAVVLTGSFGVSGYGEDHNPGAMTVEVDGAVVATSRALDESFAAGFGKARVAFAPTAAEVVTIRLPWLTEKVGRARQAPWLGEVEVEGWMGVPPAKAHGALTVSLVDALRGTRRTVLEQAVSVGPLEAQRIAVNVDLPGGDALHMLRLEAAYGGAVVSEPVLVVPRGRALLPLADLHPANAAGIGLNVSRGFRSFFDLGTGTQEIDQQWGQPDDLIWSYSHQFKQVSAKSRTEANRLYVTDNDMRHYITPWRSFSNGELFFPTSSSLLVEHLRRQANWAKSEIVVLSFVDRWDAGPDLDSLHGWQDFVEFDQSLRARGLAGMQGRTRTELATELHRNFEDAWQDWQLKRYVLSVTSLREAFHAAGKTVVISAQSIPMVAGEPGQELARTIRGMSDDSTWGMLDGSVVLTTGRQMSELAFNPVWEMSTLLDWGYNSSIFNNWQWHSPVSTTEPSRRHYYDRAWRGTVRHDGAYGSVYTYGYTSNAGVAFTTHESEWQQWWAMQERHSLIVPEAPVGAGLVISTQDAADPRHVRFNCADPLTMTEARLVTRGFGILHEAGISLPFAANIRALAKWTGSAPLILLNLPSFAPEEVALLEALHGRGTRLVAFAERSSLTPAMAELFGREGTLLVEVAPDALTRGVVAKALPAMMKTLDPEIRFAVGTAGYGFRVQQTTFVVVEDWQEEGRVVDLQWTPARSGGSLHACDINEHKTLAVTRAEGHWLIHVPLRSGDGALVAIQEG
jgi:hypothetical protein